MGHIKADTDTDKSQIDIWKEKMMEQNKTGKNDSANPEKSHFGFKDIDAAEKAGMVKGVFENVASKYDVMNDFMSGGLHRLWKASLIDSINPMPHMALIDVAGGTGDISFRFIDKLKDKTKTLPLVTVCDINQAMLDVGKDRAIDKGMISGINWVCGDAEKLPFDDCSFDVYTIAFGIRNVTHIDKALAEAKRVLKPGGHFLCLEFSNPDQDMLRKIYDWYSFNIIPTLGGLVADDKESYQYLVESIRRFPKQKAFQEMIDTAGFERASYRNLSGGIVAIHSGWRL